LPPPGYNAARPYCFRLKFSSGETNIFQTGTEDLTLEWVSTCNYWAARRSRPPLPGGVTNAEYGWRSLESRQEDRDDTVSVFSNRSSKSKMSFQNTLGRRNSSLVPISEWEAPRPTLAPSTLDEELQLESLQRHLENLAKDLKSHESYEEPLNRLVSTDIRLQVDTDTRSCAVSTAFQHSNQSQG
jgi:PH/SEC7 domain-containing protein